MEFVLSFNLQKIFHFNQRRNSIVVQISSKNEWTRPTFTCSVHNQQYRHQNNVKVHNKDIRTRSMKVFSETFHKWFKIYSYDHFYIIALVTCYYRNCKLLKKDTITSFSWEYREIVQNSSFKNISAELQLGVQQKCIKLKTRNIFILPQIS